MRCEVAREALSARIDGENEGVPSARVDEHLAGCADCQAWYAVAAEQSYSIGTGPALVGPDPTDDILARAGVKRQGVARYRRERLTQNVIRVGLTVCGFAQIVVAMVQMTGADFGMDVHSAMSGDHLMNETTAWSMALGVCMVVAAWWQRALPGLLVVLAVFTVVLGGYVVSDAVNGDVTGWRVASHLPVVTGLVFAAWGSRPSTVSRRG